MSDGKKHVKVIREIGHIEYFARRRSKTHIKYHSNLYIKLKAVALTFGLPPLGICGLLGVWPVEPDLQLNNR